MLDVIIFGLYHVYIRIIVLLTDGVSVLAYFGSYQLSDDVIPVTLLSSLDLNY